MIRAIATCAQRALLPRTVKVRTVPLGIGTGLRLRIDFRLDSTFYFGFYESPLNCWLRGMIPAGTRCFDLGAYRGWHALIFARLSGRPVVTIDTNPETAPLIAENAGLNDFDIRFVNAFVGDGRDGSATIDSLAEQHFVPDFIKMDIEGSEADALRGATRVLRDRGPGLIIEVHGAEQERRCFETLSSFGYAPRVVSESRWQMKLERRSEAGNRWLVAGSPSAWRPPLERGAETGAHSEVSSLS